MPGWCAASRCSGSSAMDDFLPIVLRSFAVSLSATVCATLVGLPLAAALALGRWPGRPVVLVMVHGLLGLPPVVVGLVLYLLLSRSGPLGVLGWLYSPAAMVMAQAVLATPIIAALAHRAIEGRWIEYGRALQASGASRLAALPHLLRMAQGGICTAVLAGFGRTVSEVGAVLIVGGNIAGVTRTMTTAITLETGKGNFDLALALGLVLVGISISASTIVLLAGRERA